MKRVKLTHGSARVDNNVSEETLKALDELSKIAYGMDFGQIKPEIIAVCHVCKSQVDVKSSFCVNCIN